MLLNYTQGERGKATSVIPRIEGITLTRLSLTHAKPIIRHRVGRSAPTIVGLIPSEKGQQPPGFARELAEHSLQSTNPFCNHSGKC